MLHLKIVWIVLTVTDLYVKPALIELRDMVLFVNIAKKKLKLNRRKLMDWSDFGKKVAGAAIKSTAAMSEEMGRTSAKMSRDTRYSEEKRAEYRRKSESHLDGARQINSYYEENFGRSEEERD